MTSSVRRSCASSAAVESAAEFSNVPHGIRFYGLGRGGSEASGGSTTKRAKALYSKVNFLSNSALLTVAGAKPIPCVIGILPKSPFFSQGSSACCASTVSVTSCYDHRPKVFPPDSGLQLLSHSFKYLKEMFSIRTISHFRTTKYDFNS